MLLPPNPTTVTTTVTTISMLLLVLLWSVVLIRASKPALCHGLWYITDSPTYPRMLNPTLLCNQGLI